MPFLSCVLCSPSLCLVCNSAFAHTVRRVLLSVPSVVFFLVSVLTEVVHENPATLFVSCFSVVLS